MLVGLLAAIGAVMVPCHWTSIWSDREFTGWVVPIGNRLASGQLLYADGGHTPLPPLPFVLSALLFGHRGIWLSESALNFASQSLAILFFYAGTTRWLRAPVPFLTALATMPIFFSLPKTIAYDAITQAFVSLVAVVAVEFLFTPGSVPVDSSTTTTATTVRPRTVVGLAAVALAAVACVLSKQSTGLATVAGVAGALFLFPQSINFGSRLLRVGLFLLAFSAAALAACAVLTPFMSVRGFWQDVFLTGSEPKGGITLLQSNLQLYVRNLWPLCTMRAACAVLALAYLGWPRQGLRVGEHAISSPDDRRPADRELIHTPTGRGVLCVAAVLGALAGFIMLLGAPPPTVLVPGFSSIVGVLPINILTDGLLLCVAITIVAALLAASKYAGALPREIEVLAALTVITVPAAVGHNLSVGYLRWTYDNNPLIMVALAAVAWFTLSSIRRWLPGRVLPVAVGSVLVAGLEFALWTAPGAAVQRVRLCTEQWPEVHHLAGARLPASAAALRGVVQLVRRLAPNATDHVLLLPDDPNVESWFERPRPALSAPIVFVDQYWSRYVDDDFVRLSTDPPKVIVIGPRLAALFVQNCWGGANRAARLIERVDKELIPKRYRLAVHQKIITQVPPYEDFLDIYVRVD